MDLTLEKATRAFVLFLTFLILQVPTQGARGEEGKARELSEGPLSIERAVEYGLAHNPGLQASREEVNATGQQVKQARADFFPSLDTHYRFQHLNEEPYVSFGGEPLNAGMPSRIINGHTTTNLWEIELIQPVFTGFGLTAQLNSARLNTKIAEHQLETTRLDLIRDIQNGFLQTLLAEKLLQVARDNVKSLEVQRENAQANYEQGLTPQNDVYKADVALAQARQQERAAEKQLLVFRARLNQLLNRDLEAPLDLSDEGIHTNPRPDLETLYALAQRRRPEYLAFATAVERAEEDITVARSRYYPRLSAFGRYYREGNDFLAETNDFANNDNAAIGLRVDWNLFEGGRTRAAVNEHRYRIKALENQRRDLGDQIKVQVKDAFEQLQVARANIETAEVGLKQALENERLTTLQYKEQLVIFLEVLNAQVFVLQSRVDYYQALYGYQLAWADLERATGGPIEKGTGVGAREKTGKKE